MKLCKDCNTEKHEDEFRTYRSKGKYSYKQHRCSECEKVYQRERAKEYYEKNKSRISAKHRARYGSHKQQVLDYYGSSCECCGEKEPLFLTVDHVKNDGHLHRKGNDTSHHNIYKWLVLNNFPDDFQILCMNCNQGKHRNNGVCPHKEAKQKIMI